MMGEDDTSIEISRDTFAALEARSRDDETVAETIERLLDGT